MTTSEHYDYLFKFIIIGDAATGKSCILHRFLEKTFKSDSTHTIGVEFGSRVLELGDRSIKLQIWDTAGQERFRSVTRSYYRGALGCLLVYDITNRESYNHVPIWLQDARSLASTDLVVILVGNKCDLQSDREVAYLEASKFAQENDIMFLETSAKTGEGIEEVFTKCVKTILSRIDAGLISVPSMGSTITKRTSLDGSPRNDEKRGCQC